MLLDDRDREAEHAELRDRLEEFSNPQRRRPSAAPIGRLLALLIVGMVILLLIWNQRILQVGSTQQALMSLRNIPVALLMFEERQGRWPGDGLARDAANGLIDAAESDAARRELVQAGLIDSGDLVIGYAAAQWGFTGCWRDEQGRWRLPRVFRDAGRSCLLSYGERRERITAEPAPVPPRLVCRLELRHDDGRADAGDLQLLLGEQGRVPDWAQRMAQMQASTDCAELDGSAYPQGLPLMFVGW